MNYFVTAIDTDSGKTLASAILCEALRADYWKPVQAGLPSDAETVRSLVTNDLTRIHPERYKLSLPASPHAAAKADGLSIRLDDFVVPETERPLIIEGAGGCMVPLNDSELMIDMMVKFQTSVIVVADLYLGSINHTLLTLDALSRRNLKVSGVIFNGYENQESERIILQRSGLPCLLRIKREPRIDATIVNEYAKLILLRR